MLDHHPSDRFERCRAWVRRGAMLPLALGAAAVAAGPVEDTQQAEAAFRSGDLIVAMSLFKRAADSGHAPAQVRLADLLDAAEQDAEAVLLYRLAATQGDAGGMAGLARMLAQGEGVKRDVAQALDWYRRAADAGHAGALDALSRAYRSGDLGLPRDPVQADALAARAAQARAAARTATAASAATTAGSR